MARLFLPRAKYRDSIVIKRDASLNEVFVNEVRGEFIDGELVWMYYLTGKEGKVDVIHDVDILMNLSTQERWEDEFSIINN